MARFVLLYGILRAGVPFGILTAIVDYFFDYGLSPSGIGSYMMGVRPYMKLLFSILFFGIWVGVCFWYIGEWHYSKGAQRRGGSTK